MRPSHPRSGYTLPVFACAAAIAALHWLRYRQPLDFVTLDLIIPDQSVEILIDQVAGLREGIALAMSRSDPGDNLDLTRNTPIWALVEWRGGDKEVGESVIIAGGEGLGRHSEGGQPAIYAYAQKLLRENLERLLEPGEKIQVTIILPKGRDLAERTSNAAFGIVEGLSLLGTTGISQPLSAPSQLDVFRDELQAKASCFDCLVFCVGENGLDLAEKLGINTEQTVKTANWLGPLLVEAGLQGVKAILLFGYHGKLMKLAGGIFHTHHHLADGRLEILTAHCADQGLPTPVLKSVLASPTAEAALKYLRNLDATNGSDWVSQVYGAIASAIDQRSQHYIFSHSEGVVAQASRPGNPTIGSILFDRDRQIIIKSKTGSKLLAKLC